MTHHFTLRTDGQNERHIHLTVFANGANCGRLCMTNDEWAKFSATFLIGARRNQDVDVSVTASVMNESQDDFENRIDRAAYEYHSLVELGHSREEAAAVCDSAFGFDL